MLSDPRQVLLGLIALIVSLTFHEAAHAITAHWLGDDTAKKMGRITLNPMAHLDPLGTIMMIFTLLSGFGIGWAKPVPVDPRYLRPNPNVGMALVAVAGPITNLLLATVLVFLIDPAGAWSRDLARFVYLAFVINISLAVFNMIPIPPLDGFNVVLGFLPERQAWTLRQYAVYGPMLLLALIFIVPGFLGRTLGPAVDAIETLLLHLARL